MLEIVDPAWLEGGAADNRVIRQDQHGRGVSEFAYVTAEGAGWLMAVAKYRSGFGTVTFRLREADGFLLQAASATLPGVATGAPNSGPVAGHDGVSLVIPSRVTVDLSARSVNVFDQQGVFRPGWPVFVFPQSSSQGGLGLPMVADMDGQPGAEIVVASDFGYIYFFAGDGEFSEVALVINRPLTTPVGIRHADGDLRAVAADKSGLVRAWSHGPVLRAEVSLGHVDPHDPAVGLLTAGDEESVVVAFADGHVAVLDPDLDPRPGWPVDLDRPVAVAPVLADLDGNGRHEIVLPCVDPATGVLTMRVLDGAGAPAVGDGAVVPSPGGGPWLGLAPAVVAGGYFTDDLHVAVGGLAANGFAGDQARWRLGFGNLAANGTVSATTLMGFEVGATTAEGVLEIGQLLLPAPLTWNYTGGGGSEPVLLAGVHWNELLYGFTAIPGGVTAWFRDGPAPEPLAVRQPVRPGGKNDPPPAHLGAMLVDAGEASLRVQAVDDAVTIIPVAPRRSSTPFWRAARADARNTGALPPAPAASSVQPRDAAVRSLVAYPNPGNGRFQFRVAGWDGRGALDLEVYDLRGRRVRSLQGGAGESVLRWDGADAKGRPLAAGTYLAVVRGAGPEPLVRRVVLTR
jgi:prepilin-type processing-associated H-X9-DG protein